MEHGSHVGIVDPEEQLHSLSPFGEKLVFKSVNRGPLWRLSELVTILLTKV